MSNKSIWKKIDNSESLQCLFVCVMIMVSIAFLFGLVFLGLMLLGCI